jgi:hypothetical protein
MIAAAKDKRAFPLNLENLGRPEQSWKVRVIEEVQRLMFDGQDV